MWEIIEKENGITLWRQKTEGGDIRYIDKESILIENGKTYACSYAAHDERFSGKPWYGYLGKEFALYFPNAFHQRLWHGGITDIDNCYPVVYTFRDRLPENISNEEIIELLINEGAPEWIRKGITTEQKEHNTIGFYRKEKMI